MRVRVARFDRALVVRQLLPEVQIVVPVPGALREQRPKQVDIRTDSLPAVVQPRSQALFQVPGRRVEGTVQRLGIPFERVAIGHCLLANVYEIEPGARLDLQTQFDR